MTDQGGLSGFLPDGRPSSGGAVDCAPGSITVEIPAPPSVNEMFRNVRGKGRVKTKVYADWRGHADWYVRSQRPGRLRGHVVLIISIERLSRNADVDNRVKAILDLLVACRVIDDDRYVVAFAVSWAPAANKLARVLILPAADLAARFHLADDGVSGGWFLDPTTNQDIDHALSA